MNSKFGRAGVAGRGSAMRGMKETGPPPLGRGMGTTLQPRMQSLGAGPVGMRGAAGTTGGMGKGRLGGRDNSGGLARSTCVVASQDEKFQLQQFEVDAVRPFAMAIRLPPELLSDLKRAEADGAACLMKFGVTATGHVLKIGNEEFKFNSAREDGGLCDIFEEQRRGEDGDGILKEAGSVWRKLSVLRTLNASEKDRVKKRSVEAQQQQKSRKAIILDPTHSQNLTQNSSIAGDAVGRRPPIKTKVQPPRKKFKPNSPVRSPVRASAPVPVQQKPVVSTASAIASAKAAKAASVASPEVPPSSGKSIASLPPPLSSGKPVVAVEEGSTPSMSSVQMDSTPSPATTTTPDTVVASAKPGAIVVGPTELRNCLITLLKENPKGMTLKAVEKSLGDSMPHVKPEKKTIEKAIRAIASYHAPGKYILKEGVAFAKPSPNSGSSPEHAAADSPPLVDDSPVLLPDMNVDSSIHDEILPGAVPRHNESGSLGDKPGSQFHSSATTTRKAPSIVQKSNENAVSRAIRKVSESYQKSQPAQSRPAPEVEIQEQIGNVGGDESGEIEIIEGGNSLPDIHNGDNTRIEKKMNGDDESDPNSPKEKRATNSGGGGGSESSSSSGSSDSDTESSDSGDSCSGTSGSGSDSDSDGSSSDSDDENMDEDVEIVSDDEDGDPPHQKPRANDKKKASHQSKDSKRAKLKPPDIKLLETEKVDIGDEVGAGDPVGDPEERAATVMVENLDTDIDLEVDVVSVGGGDDSPQHNTGSVSPIISEQRQMEEESNKREELVNTPAAVMQKSTSRERNSSSILSKKEPATETGTETGDTQKDTSISKLTELGKSKTSALKGNNGTTTTAKYNNSSKVSSRSGAKESPVHNTNHNNRPPARDSLIAQSASPSRPETGKKSLLGGSPALKKEAATEMIISPRLAKENSIAKRRVNNLEGRKSVSMGAAKTEPEELVEKLVEAPVRHWRHNSDGLGLLGKPGNNLGRQPQGRETDVPNAGKQLKNMRRGNNDLLEAQARRNEHSMNEPDSWTRDLDGTKFGNDNSDGIGNRLREGPKGSVPTGNSLNNKQNEKKVAGESPDRESGEWRESTPAKEQLDMKGKSRSLDSNAAVSRLILNKSQNREPGKTSGDFSKRPSPSKPVADFRKPSPGELSKPSPGKPVGDLRNPSPGKDIRKSSPGTTSNAQKLQPQVVAQKEPPQRFDQAVVAARDSTNRSVSGLGKLLEERPIEGGISSRNNNTRASNDGTTFESRPMESQRGVKRQLDDGCSEQPPRMYRKPSVAPVAARPTTTDRKQQVSPTFVQKPQVLSEADIKGGSTLEGSLAGPSGKASDGRKQRPLGNKAQKSAAKVEAMELLRGRDWKAKTSGAGLLGPGGGKKNNNENITPSENPRLSNGKQRLKSSSSPEEVSGRAYFAKYEKDAPDLRAPIRSPEEAEAYKKEYQSKYHVYTRLYSDLGKNGGHFHSFKREMLQATSHPDKLQQISTKVRREFYAIRKEFKRMQKTFDILHEELQTIKQHLRNFAAKAG